MAVSQLLDRDSPHITSSFSSTKPRDVARGKSHIFHPPETPVSESYGSSSGYADRRSDGVTTGRKRPRPGSAGSDSLTPFSAATSHWTSYSVESSAIRSAAASPPLFVNTRYNLRHGVDTPTAEAEARFEYADQWRDVDYRRKLSVGNAPREASSHFTDVINLGERNGERRLHSSPNSVQFQSWGRFVINIVGGVAGTMWEICKATAFRGFYAGGGKGYAMPPPIARDISDSGAWEDMDASRMRLSREATPIPGQYPEEDHFTSQPSSETRPAKRLHTDTVTGWVMVSTAGEAESRASTPRLSVRRRPPATNTAESRRSTASRPAFRRSLAPVSRRSLGVSHGGSPVLQAHHRRASHAPARTPAAGTPTQNASPASVEAQRYAERKRREERQTDASIKRLNEQLMAMIKEGKEALGSKVEIVDDENEMDEGFEEGVFGQSVQV